MTPVPGGDDAHALIFVYGTLRSGERNHHWLRQSTRVGDHRTTAAFRLLDVGGFPGAILGGNQRIVGEVYRVKRVTLGRLDQLEGYPEVFDRMQIDTEFGACWMYLYRKLVDSQPVIPSGDWVRR